MRTTHAGRWQTGSDELASILERLARVATLYRDEALSFACRETITDTRFGAGGRVQGHQGHEFDYIYVFNDPDDPVDPTLGPGLVDYRTDPEADVAVGGPQPIELADLGLDAYLSRPYSWTFLFQKTRQGLYEFHLEETDEVLDRSAHVVSFAPQGLFGAVGPEWVGRVWVDRETFQLLRVEAARARDVGISAAARQRGRERPGETTAYLVLSVETEFAVVQNGMRFPSRVRLEGRMVGRSGPDAADALVDKMLGFARRGTGFSERKVFEVRQRYDDYRFFSVRSEEEVFEIIGIGRGQGTGEPRR